MKLEDIRLNEISQAHKDKCCVIPLTPSTLSSQNHRDRKYYGRYQGSGEGTMESQCLMGTDFQFYKMKRVLGMAGGDGCTT